MSTLSSRSGRRHAGKPFQPAVGREIEIDEVPAIEARTRDFLAKTVATCVAVAMALTGGHALMTGSHVAVEVVWAIAGPMVGALMAYYFGAQRRETR